MTKVNSAIPPVSDAERKWVQALATGKAAKDVAAQFGMKEGTFAYKMNILRGRFGCENTNGLIAYFLRNKLID